MPITFQKWPLPLWATQAIRKCPPLWRQIFLRQRRRATREASSSKTKWNGVQIQKQRLWQSASRKTLNNAILSMLSEHENYKINADCLCVRLVKAFSNLFAFLGFAFLMTLPWTELGLLWHVWQWHETFQMCF
jgi:hypothetical protein